MTGIDEISLRLGELARAVNERSDDVRELVNSLRDVTSEMSSVNTRLALLESTTKRVDAAEKDITELQRWRWKAAGAVTFVMTALSYFGFKH